MRQVAGTSNQAGGAGTIPAVGVERGGRCLRSRERRSQVGSSPRRGATACVAASLLATGLFLGTAGSAADGSGEKASDSAAEKQESSGDATLNELLGLPEKSKKTADTKKEGEKQKPKKEPSPFRALQPNAKQEGPAPDEKVPTEQPGSLFGRIVADIGSAADQLQAGELGLDTQRAQERAIDRLDQLISKLSQRQRRKPQSSQSQSSQKSKGAKKQQSQQQRRGASPSNQPASGPTSGSEPKKGKPSEGPLSENLSEWGNLPPRLREKLMQGVDEDFSALYRSETEAYYERLAEEQKAEQ